MTKKKNHDIVMTMVEVGVMAALGFVLDELSGIMFKGVFVNGGSIGIAMVCVLVMAFRRGFVPALATGVVMGLLDLATGPYIIPGDAWRAFVQVFLDYVAAYPMVAFAAIFRKAFLNAEEKQKKVLFLCLGSILGGLLKLFAHFLSGILFWADPSGFALSLLLPLQRVVRLALFGSFARLSSRAFLEDPIFIEGTEPPIRKKSRRNEKRGGRLTCFCPLL